MKGIIEEIFLVAFFVSIFFAPSLRAFWIADGVALCTANGDQVPWQIISDGAGGAIVTWHDNRSGNEDIYAQRVNASGEALWTANGVALCTATGNQRYPAILSDGAGGAIVTWEDYRSGGCNIYAQRVDANGAVQWISDGVVLCAATGGRANPTIISDGAGGAIVAWNDSRSGNQDIYAQKVSAYGVVQWTLNGVGVCTYAGDQIYPVIIPDGAGGAIMTWQDYTNLEYNIYAQRINADGELQWASRGVAIVVAMQNQRWNAITSDGAGGAIVTWQDYRSGNWDIYAQRVNAAGVVQWTSDGVPICTATGGQEQVKIISDGSGGAIITWEDYRSGNWDIYAQRINASGVIQWMANGLGICTMMVDQVYPTIASDGSGGAIVAWHDYRNANADIYAQRVDGSGLVQWNSNGVPICTAIEKQYFPLSVSDEAGGAIVSWWDARSGNWDIYIQSIDNRGRVGFLAPSISAVRDIPGDQGGKVYLSWYAARSDFFMDGTVSYYSLWRAINPRRTGFALESGASILDDLSMLDVSSDKPVIYAEKALGRTYFWELVGTVDALYMEAYGKPVTTLFDSTAVCNEYTYFQVVAHTSVPKVFWKSEPDSGYSVDNLPPCAPKGLMGQQSFIPEGLQLVWERNEEGDLGEYRVYRGLSENFEPGLGNRQASLCDTVYFDSAWRWDGGFYYKISAVDVHGNESSFSLLRPEDVSGEVAPKVPEVSYLAQNYPNPFNPTTKICYGLSEPSRVVLGIYDVSGRLVRKLREGQMQAGRYEQVWDGLNDSGMAVASGVYFYRLDAGFFKETRKMILAR